MKPPRTNICLNMIVKNETKVLERLIRSVKDYIDYYVIVDTGSSDGTPDFIRKTMGELGIEGEVHGRDWVNFGVNRQQALELAVEAKRGDWLLFIDADEELGVSNPEFFRELEAGVSYDIEKRHSGSTYAVPHLVDVRRSQWRWEGPVHNYLVLCGGSQRRARRKDVWIVYHPGEGAKSHGVTATEKFLRDARILEEDLEKNPTSARSQFYLAQSYKDAGQHDKACEAYRKRVEMGGWEEERFMAQLELGRLARILRKSEAVVVKALLDAYEMRPTRAEPLHELASYFRMRKQYGKAYVFAKVGSQTPRPDDSLFVGHDVYEWRIFDELGVAAYWVGRYRESKDACEEVLRRVAQGVAQGLEVPESHVTRVRQNLVFADRKLGLP